jgi:hypothetical protein
MVISLAVSLLLLRSCASEDFREVKASQSPGMICWNASNLALFPAGESFQEDRDTINLSARDPGQATQS